MAINWFFAQYVVTTGPRGNPQRRFPTNGFVTDRVRVVELPNNNILVGVRAVQIADTQNQPLNAS